MIRPQKLTKKQALFVLFSTICIISFFAVAFLTSAPKIEINGSEYVYLKVGEYYVESGARATDAQGHALPVEISGHVDSSKPGETEIVYTAIRYGRITQTTRTVTVLENEK